MTDIPEHPASPRPPAGRPRLDRLRGAVTRAIAAADPMGLLAAGAPADEYAPEVGTVVPRVVGAAGVDEVRVILHEEFVRWFGREGVGPPEGFAGVAEGIWRAVREFRGGES